MINIPTLTDFNVIRHSTSLSNGLRVSLFERPKTPIHMELSFLAGSLFDPEGKEGLAHFTEHVVAGGSKNYPTQSDLEIYIGSLGGGYNATTGNDTLNIEVSVVDPEDFSKAVNFLNEVVCYSLFNTTTVENERLAILNELAMSESDPGNHVFEVYQSLVYQGTPLEHPILGTMKSIRGITRDDIVSYHKNMFTTGRAALTICGGIGLDQVISELEEGLTIPKSERMIIGKELPVFRARAIKTRKYSINDQVNLIFGYRTCPMYVPEEIPLLLLAQIMGGGLASSLYKKLRFDRGLVYFVNTFIERSLYGGTYSVATETSKKDLPEVMDLITREFNRIVQGGVTESEIDFAKSKLIKSQKGSMQTSENWVEFHSRDELIGDSRRQFLPELLKNLSLVTDKEITDAANKYFKENYWYLAGCGNLLDKDLLP